MKKNFLILLAVMSFIAIASFIFINLLPQVSLNDETETDKNTTAEYDTKPETETIKILTTFYPIYMIGLNIADGIDQIEINSLTDLDTGCLHDYQLTTADMKLISDADVLVINGGGMEGFLEDVTSNYPNLTIIDSSQGIEMMEYGTSEYSNNHADGYEEILDDDHEDINLVKEVADHQDEHVGENTDGNADINTDVDEHLEDSSSDHIDAGHDHSHGEYNSHIWLNPQLYMKQIENVQNGLIEYIEHSNDYKDEDSSNLVKAIELNVQSYIQQVSELDKEIEHVVVEMTANTGANDNTLQAVIFHDAFAYLADRIGIKVAFTVPLDTDTSLSAGDIATIIDEVKEDKIKFLFTEEQYSDSIARQIESETEAKLYIIDSVVTGNGDKNSYLIAMKNNLEVIRAALQ